MQVDLIYPKFISEDSIDFLSKLLVADPDKRLGSSHRDANEIKEHHLFGDMNWKDLLSGLVEPPWKPVIEDSYDTSHFDARFTGLSMDSLRSLSKMEESFEAAYANFDYFDNSAILREDTPQDEYKHRYHPGESKYIRDEQGFSVSKQGFFASWVSTAKRLITKAESTTAVSKKV